MWNAAARGHPVDRARLDVLHRADAVAVHELSFEKVGHRRQPDMRVRTDIGVPEGLELLRTEMIEEKERPYGLPFRGGTKAAHPVTAHRANLRLQYQAGSHSYTAALFATRNVRMRVRGAAKTAFCTARGIAQLP